MDVDSDNFEKALQIFQEHLGSAAFVSLDIKLTGQHNGLSSEYRFGDLPDVRYAEAKQVVEQFGIMQIGLSLFEETSGQSVAPDYICRPFNFFLFPQPINEGLGDAAVRHSSRFDVDTDTIQFHKSHGKDFGRWLGKGIPFVDGPLENRLRGVKHVLTGDEKDDGGAPHSDVQAKLAEVAQELLDGKKGTERQLPYLRGASTTKALAILRGRLKEGALGVELRKGNLGGCRPAEVWAINIGDRPDDQKKWQAEAKKRADAKHKGLLGFRRLWNTISSSESAPPIVTHDGLLSALAAVHWLEEPLPPDYRDFQRLARKVFQSGVYDTKWLATYLDESLGSAISLGEFSLELTTAELRGEVPAFNLATDFLKYAEGNHLHEAGFDAFIVGKLFAYYKLRNPPPPPDPVEQMGKQQGGYAKDSKGKASAKAAAKGPVNRFALLGGDSDEDDDEDDEEAEENTAVPVADLPSLSFMSAYNRLLLLDGLWDLCLDGAEDPWRPMSFRGEAFAARYVPDIANGKELEKVVKAAASSSGAQSEVRSAGETAAIVLLHRPRPATDDSLEKALMGALGAEGHEECWGAPIVVNKVAAKRAREQ